MDSRFISSAKLCAENAERLLTEAQLLEFEKPPATKNFLSIIAQEECAKGFLLYLVAIGTIPWNNLILRAARDHKCKQLVGVIIDFLTPDFDEFLKRLHDKGFLDFPREVADAMNILRYEKIGRWNSNNWVWDQQPEYDEVPLSIAKGKRDEEKQQSLYVELSKNGEAVLSPSSVTEKLADFEFEKGKRFARFLGRLMDGSEPPDSDFQTVVASFKSLFSDPL